MWRAACCPCGAAGGVKALTAPEDDGAFGGRQPCAVARFAASLAVPMRVPLDVTEQVPFFSVPSACWRLAVSLTSTGCAWDTWLLCSWAVVSCACFGRMAVCVHRHDGGSCRPLRMCWGIQPPLLRRRCSGWVLLLGSMSLTGGSLLLTHTDVQATACCYPVAALSWRCMLSTGRFWPFPYSSG